jgi:hypothetical protein
MCCQQVGHLACACPPPAAKPATVAISVQRATHVAEATAYESACCHPATLRGNATTPPHAALRDEAKRDTITYPMTSVPSSRPCAATRRNTAPHHYTSATHATADCCSSVRDHMLAVLVAAQRNTGAAYPMTSLPSSMNLCCGTSRL